MNIKYNYNDAVRRDILNTIRGDSEYLPHYDEDRDEYRERLMDELWASDVTGNNGSTYYFSDMDDAAFAVMTNLELCRTAYIEFECEDSAVQFLSCIQAADVTIRCYVLPSAIDAAIDELGFFKEED